MRTSLLAIVTIAAAFSVFACAGRGQNAANRSSPPLRSAYLPQGGLVMSAATPQATPTPTAQSYPSVHTSTLTITPGIPVAAQIPMSPDFQPDAHRAPLWLRNGATIGVVG